jgi:hypothetical protein
LKALIAVLQPLVAGLECGFTAAPLGEQRGQNQRAQRRDEHCHLGGAHALEDCRARVAEPANPKSCRRHEANCDDERRGRSEQRTAAGRDPQEHRK